MNGKDVLKSVKLIGDKSKNWESIRTDKKKVIILGSGPKSHWARHRV